MRPSKDLLAESWAVTWAVSHDPTHERSAPLRLQSEANKRDKWGGIRRAKASRAVGFLLARGLAVPTEARLVVLLTRCSPRQLDRDNLARALKAVRDGVADALGVDDRDPRVVWLVDQARTAEGEHSVALSVWAV